MPANEDTTKDETLGAGDSTVDFEESLSQLESLVEEMESGELSLEDSLVAFEKGVALTRSCKEALRKAEERVAQLTESSDLEE